MARGSVHSYTLKSTNERRYAAVYRDADHKQVWKRGFTRKDAAEDYLAHVTVSQNRGEYVDPSDAKAPISTLGAVWLESRQSVMKPSAYRPVDSAWRIHVQPKWGKRQVGSVKHSEIQAWVSGLTQSHSATTTLRALGVLSGILDTAVKDRRIATNPARDLTLPRKKPKPRAYLTHAQVARLADASRHPEIVFTLAYTGLRWGEMSALRVKHTDTEKRRLNVTENAVLVGSFVEVGTPKSHKTRSVPFPAFLAPTIKQACMGKAPDDLLFGDGKLHMRLPNSRDGWFAAAVRRLRTEDEAAAERARNAGEPVPAIFPRVTPHDLRHTAASLAISAGASVKVLQQMLGHASAAMTLDVYSDLFPDDLDDVANALDQAVDRTLVSTVLARHQSEA